MLVNPIDSQKGFVKVQLLDLLVSYRANTSVCRLFDMTPNNDRLDIFINQLRGMMNGIRDNGYICLCNIIKQQFICRPRIHKNHIIIRNKRSRFLSHTLLVLNVFDRFLLNGKFFFERTRQLCPTMNTVQLMLAFQFI